MTRLIRTPCRLQMKSCMFTALALTFILPVEGHSQAKTTPKWLECFAPNECDIQVFATALHGRKGRLRLLAARAASACQAAGYSHYVAGNVGGAGYRIVQRVYFTRDTAPPARPCSFSATAELKTEAMEIAGSNGYPWPVSQAEEATGWTFESGENDWGEKVPFFDDITSPFVPALRSDQGDLFGRLSLGRDCSVTLMVGQEGSGPEADFDFWAYWDGGLDREDQILEVRVDGASVKEQGRNATKPTADMVMSSRQTFGVYVRSAEHEDNAAFNWPVTDRDREVVEKHFPHCLP